MIMSSGDSALFAPAAVLANDIWKPLYEKSTKKELSDGGLMSASRWSVVIVAAFALILGFFSETMYDLLIVAFQLLYHVLFFPIILGVYWKKANAPGAVAGMITGFLFIIVWMVIAGTMFPSPEWASTLIPGGVGGVVMVIVSLITQKRRPPQPLYSSDGKILKFGELAGK
jgi:Na+/proline symporter